MRDVLSKSQLLEILRTGRAEWEALLAAVAAARMIQPGAAGHWSVKDIVCHITAYERWLAAWLEAAAQQTFPNPSPLDDADIARRNARVHELTRDQPLPEVMADAQQTFAALLQSVERLPDVYFSDPQRAEWFMKPYWSRMETVAEAVINLSTDHYKEHIPGIRAWIEEADSN